MVASNHDKYVYPYGLAVQIWPNAAPPLILKGRGALVTLAPSGGQLPNDAKLAISLAPSACQPLSAAQLYSVVRAVEFSRYNAVHGPDAVRSAVSHMSVTGLAVLQFQTDADAIAYASQFFPQAVQVVA